MKRLLLILLILAGCNKPDESVLEPTPDLVCVDCVDQLSHLAFLDAFCGTDKDATPTVAGANTFVYAGSANAVTITDLDNPTVGEYYTLIGNSDTYTMTIDDSGNFKLSAQWVGGVDDVLYLYCKADNYYVEVSRSNN